MYKLFLNNLAALIRKMHVKIFGHEMSPTMTSFLKNISWSFIGVIVNSGLLFLVSVLAGRILGPVEYGKYSFVSTLGGIFLMFMLLSADIASVRFISRSKKNEEQKQYITTSFGLVFVLSCFVFSLVFIMREVLASFMGVDKIIIVLGLFYALFWTFKNLFDSFLRSLKLYTFQAMVKVIEGFSVVIIFCNLFLVLHKNTYEYYVYSLLGGIAILLIFYARRLYPFLANFQNKKMFKLINYARSTTIVLVVIVAISGVIDKLFIGKYLGEKMLGIYSAYLMSTVIFATQIIVVIDNVLLPMINNVDEKHEVIKKIDKLALIFFVPGFLFIFLLASVVLHFFGSSYEINHFYVLIFSMVAFVQVLFSIYRNVIISTKKARAAFTRLSCAGPFLMAVILFFLARYNLITFERVIFVYGTYNLYYLFISRFSYRLEY